MQLVALSIRQRLILFYFRNKKNNLFFVVLFNQSNLCKHFPFLASNESFPSTVCAKRHKSKYQCTNPNHRDNLAKDLRYEDINIFTIITNRCNGLEAILRSGSLHKHWKCPIFSMLAPRQKALT